jgi:Sigma-70 region 2
MRRHNQRLYRIICVVLRREDEVEDVMQQTYMNAFAHLAQFKRRSRFSTWLIRIAIREALMMRKRRRARPTTMSPLSRASRRRRTTQSEPPPRANYEASWSKRSTTCRHVIAGVCAEGNRGLEHGRDGGRASDRGPGGENASAPSENNARTAASRAWWRGAAVVSIYGPSMRCGCQGCLGENTPATPIPAWALLIAGC